MTDADQLRAALGRDLFFDGNLQVAAKGDWQTVDGEENLRRAVLRMLITTPGSYKFRPNYGAGVADFVKKRATKSDLDALRARIVDQLTSMRRVDKVISVELNFSNDRLSIVVQVQASGRIIRPLNYDFAKAV